MPKGWYALVPIHKHYTIWSGLPWWDCYLNQWPSEVPQRLAHWLHLLWWLCAEVQGRWTAHDMPGWDWLWSYLWALARLCSSMQHHQFRRIIWGSCGGVKKLNMIRSVVLMFPWSLKYTSLKIYFEASKCYQVIYQLALAWQSPLVGTFAPP